MEEAPVNMGWFHRNRKPLAVVILLILIPPITVYTINAMYNIYLDNNPELDPTYEISHSLTVWIAPREEEFHLHLDFYGSEQDVYSEINRYSGLSIRVQPLDDEEKKIYLYTIPESLLSVWVKIYFDQSTKEPCIILRIDLGQKITTTLIGREISILVEPYQE